jgi:thioesterase domain-containing protein
MPTDIRIVNTANEIIKNNNAGSIHLIGYSTGSVVMAQTALYLYKEKGIKVTSLLLIGTPIHKNSELWKELINLGIAFYYYDIPGDDVKLKKLSVLSFAVQGNNHSHFALAFGKEAQKKRKKLFNNYYQQLNTKH